MPNTIARPLRAALPFAVLACLAAAGCELERDAGAAESSLGALPDLGAAQTYALLAGSSVTATGLAVIHGDVGVSPGSAINGFPPATIAGGVFHAGDAAAATAQNALTAAYNDLAGQPCDTVLTSVDLGGMTLMPGVYCFATSAQLTGTLTLDGLGNPNAVFVFKIGSTLTTASSSAVNMIGSAIAGRVFWQVGSSASLGTGTDFSGNILAQASITAATGSSIAGRALARTGAVTVDAVDGQAVPITPPVDAGVVASDGGKDAGTVIAADGSVVAPGIPSTERFGRVSGGMNCTVNPNSARGPFGGALLAIIALLGWGALRFRPAPRVRALRTKH
jgi:hypothetical protein